MKMIALSGKLGKGKFALVDDEDFEELNKYQWHLHHGYAARKNPLLIKPKSMLMHRIIMQTPFGVYVDHKDRNELNNQKHNLRNCNNSENGMNKKVPSNNTSGYKGVRIKKEGYITHK